MRDAALNGNIPTIEQMTQRPDKWFVYRYGESLWSYIGARWGDETIGQILRAAPNVGYERAIKRENDGLARIAVAVTIALGVVFFAIQVLEYQHHLRELTPESNAYGSIVWFMLGMHLLLLAVIFATTRGGRTILGPGLGADFAGFYPAGTILNAYPPDRLYDLALQDRLYHRLLPAMPPGKGMIVPGHL